MFKIENSFLTKSLTGISLLLVFNSFSSADSFKDNFSGVWGMGMGVLQSNYKDEERTATLSPYIFGNIGDLQIEANRLLYPLYKTQSYGILATANYRTQQYSEILGLDKSIELGLTFELPLSYGYTSRLTALPDVSDTHNGYELEAQVYRHDSIGKLSILSALAIQYQDDNLANYYYGTNTYTVDDAYVYEAEVIATYPIGDFAVFAGVRSYWYNENISNSPLASSSNTVLGFMGVGYRF